MDLIERLIDDIEGHIELYEKIRIIPLSAGKDAISILLIGSKPEKEYMDSQIYNKISFKIMAKSSDSKEAYETVEKITSYIRRLQINEIKSLDNSFIFIKAEIEENVNLSKMDTGQKYIYESKVGVYVEV